MNPATRWGESFLDELARLDVRHVCIAPGSRSAPWVLAAAQDSRFRRYVHLDERAAAFFALGIGKATGHPAAVITTSGTAAANLFPAVIEASHAETPLLLLTADRPPRLRDTDANQAIDQRRLFGDFTRATFDLAVPTPVDADLRHLRAQAGRAVAAALGRPAGPVHVNAPFAKPLEPLPEEEEVPAGLGARGREDGRPYTSVRERRSSPSESEVNALAERVRSARAGVIVAGPSPDPGRTGPALVEMAAATGLPLLADPLSGARFHTRREKPSVLAAYDLFLRDPSVRTALRPDLVVRFGQGPTSASLNAWLEEHAAAHQVVVDDGHRWKDHPAAAAEYVRADPATFAGAVSALVPTASPSAWRALWHDLEASAASAAAASHDEGFFEATVLADLADLTPAEYPLFVSGSMPIRDLDGFARPRFDGLGVFANRGASGIDGVGSTGLGVAAGAGQPAVVALGDIALFHDQNGLLAVREPGVDAVFVVIHNDGGGIFHLLPIREHEPHFTPYFATPHGLDFSHVAALHGIGHQRVAGRDEFRRAFQRALSSGGSQMIEVSSDRQENHRRHEAVVQAVAETARTRLHEEGTS